MNATLTLFNECPLPNCRNLVEDPRQPCGECVALFGPHLRESGRPAPEPDEYAASLREGEDAVRAILAARRRPGPTAEAGAGWRLNQHCWLCENRRKCRPDPGQPDRWICGDCLEAS